MKELTLRQKLAIIQTELVVPKNREMKGKTGKVMYRYRNCDDIFDALKPVNAKYAVYFSIDEKPVLCGDVIFRESIATIHDSETDDTISATSFVKENVSSDGFQAVEQKSGGSSSYASKLALSKLLLLDDNDDPDDRNFTEDGAKDEPYKRPSNWGTYAGKTLKQLGNAKIKQFRDKLLAKEDLTSEEKAFLEATK